MARPFTSTQRATIGGPDFWLHTWFEVLNTVGVWMDVTSLGGYNWFDSAKWTEDVDVPVASGSVFLRRSITGAGSLAPLMSASAFNPAGVPLIAPGAQCRITVAEVTSGTARGSVSSGDKFEMFRGKIDDVLWQQDPIQINVRDQGAWLQNAFITDVKTYSDAVGTPVENVLQQIIIDNAVMNNPQPILSAVDWPVVTTGPVVTIGTILGGVTTITLGATTMTGSITAIGQQFTINGIVYTATATATAASNHIIVSVFPATPIGGIVAGTPVYGPVRPPTLIVPIQGTWPLVTTGPVLTVGSTTAGATSIVIDATTMTGTVVIGEQFVINGVHYSVTANATAAGNAITLAINPAVPATIANNTPVSGTPSFNIQIYNQARDTVMNALQALALSMGFDVRYWYDATVPGVSLLTLQNPPRSKVTSDFTMGPSEYLDVTALSVSDTNVRNYIRVIYVDSITNSDQTVLVVNAGSIAAYGKRFFEIIRDNTVNITTQAQALALGNAIANDLATPDADQEITTLLCYIVQLWDLITFTANGKHYDTDQQFAVTQFTHELTGTGSGKTTIRTKGKVAGAYKQWLSRFGLSDTKIYGVPTPFISVAGSGSADGGLTVDGRCWVTVQFEPNTQDVLIYSETGPNFPLPTPDESLIVQNYDLWRPDGSQGVPYYTTQVPIATTSGWWRTVKAFGVGFDGQRSIATITTVQCGLPAIVPVVLPAVQQFLATRFGTTVVLNWALDTTGLDATAVIQITRDGQSISGAGLDQNTQSITDPSPPLYAASTYGIYISDLSLSGIALIGPTVTTTVTALNDPNGPGSGGGGGGGTPPAAGQEPQFTLGTPSTFNYGNIGAQPSGLVTVFGWTCTDPSASYVVLQFSTDGQSWTTLYQSAASTAASGTSYTSVTSRGYYRLVSYDAGGVQRAISQ